jgi:transketolase
MEFNAVNSRFLSKMGHRGAFATALLELAETVPNLAVLTADLGSLTGLDRFIKQHPDKYYNLGIAEQNLIGVAAGMAKEGFVTFATTYATFITMRSYEQIRLNVAYMGFNVKIIGTGSGLAMGMLGTSNYGIEDLALMRALPGMTVVQPCDGMEIVKTIHAAAHHVGPMYIRLTGVLNSPIVHQHDFDFQIGKAIRFREGKDLTIFAAGTMVHEALAAATALEQHGIAAAVVNMHTVKPLDHAAIDRACAESKLIVSLEEHGVVGGLGGAIAEYKATLKNTPPQLFLGIPDKFGKVAEYKYLLELYGLTAPQIARTIEGRYREL